MITLKFRLIQLQLAILKLAQYLFDFDVCRVFRQTNLPGFDLVLTLK
jgi:hypothetical protein